MDSHRRKGDLQMAKKVSRIRIVAYLDE